MGEQVLLLLPPIFAVGVVLDLFPRLQRRLHWQRLAKRGRESIPIGGALALAVTPVAVIWMGSLFPISLPKSRAEEFGFALPENWYDDLGNLVIDPSVPYSLLLLYLAGLSYVVAKLVFFLRCPSAARLVAEDFSTGATTETLMEITAEMLQPTRFRLESDAEDKATQGISHRTFSTPPRLPADFEGNQELEEHPMLRDRIAAVFEGDRVIRKIIGALQKGGQVVNLTKLSQHHRNCAEIRKALDPKYSTVGVTPIDRATELVDQCVSEYDAVLGELARCTQEFDSAQSTAALIELRGELSKSAPLSRLTVWCLITLGDFLVAIVALKGIVSASKAFV
jgi:hypothetical protein